MSKICIIGSSGQLSFDLLRVLKGAYPVESLSHSDVDVENYEGLKNQFEAIRPDIVINTAAYHKTEECENNPEKSFKVNAIGAYNTARAAANFKAKIFFISSDYVFDGSRENFTEDDLPNPLNVYGVSKLAGEILTKIANPAHYIIRTSWLFGIHQSGKGHNFVSLMFQKIKNREIIKVVDDQFGSPTYTLDLAFKIKELIDRQVPIGIYHLANSGFCSWYEFAKKIFELSNQSAKVGAIHSINQSSFVVRPKYSVLKSNRLGKLGISDLRSWPEALADYLKEVRTKI